MVEQNVIITLNASEQIDAIVRDIEFLINEEKDFVAFIILSIGIEFLGSLNDTKNFSEYKESKNRFNKGLQLLKGKYGSVNKNNKLFTDLRGALIHQYRPGKNFELTSNTVHGVAFTKHLTKRNGKVILVLEPFFEDFKSAIKELESNPLYDLKRSSQFMDIIKTNSGITHPENVNVNFSEENNTSPSYSASAMSTLDDTNKL